jgi:SPP1 family predicted phage head-tail adaptor
MMRSGQLRHRLVIEKPTAGDAGAYGERIDTWSKLDDAWGAVEELHGREAVNAAQVTPEATLKVLTRYRADVSEVMRIKWGDRYLYPIAIIPDVRKTEMTWMCKEEQ